MYLLDFVFVKFIKQNTEKILENGKKYWKSRGNLSVRKCGKHVVCVLLDYISLSMNFKN